MAASAASSLSGWHIAQRVFAGLILGFILTNTSGVFLALLPPGDVVPAVAWTTLLSWVLYLAIVIWVFSVKNLKTIWLGLIGAIVLTTAGAFGLYALGAGS